VGGGRGRDLIWIYNLQSVHLTTNVVSSNPGHGEVYSMQHFVMQFATGFLLVPPPRYNCNIVESEVKHHQYSPNILPIDHMNIFDYILKLYVNFIFCVKKI